MQVERRHIQYGMPKHETLIRTTLQHEKRYERAEEFVDIVEKLWDSWEDEALIMDKESAQFADARKSMPSIIRANGFP